MKRRTGRGGERVWGWILGGGSGNYSVEARDLTRVLYNKVKLLSKRSSQSVQWEGGFIEKSLVEKRGEKKPKRKAPGREGMGVVFLLQKRDSLPVFLTSFPHCLGRAVFDLPRSVGFELFGVLEGKLNPFARPSSPCSSGHS